MKKMNVISSLVLLCAISLSAYAQDPVAILKKLDDVLYSPKDMSGKNKIVLIDKNGKQEIREATIMQKGTDKRMFRFTEPAAQAGISVLSLPNDVMYLYMPAYAKERRISSSVKNQSFAGTDFSYEDMEAKTYSDNYNGKYIKTEGTAFVLELTPKGNSSYSKVIAKINNVHYYPESTDFYDKAGNKVKTATYTFKKIGNYWNPEKIEMTDLKKNHKTQMISSDIKYDQNLKDDEFQVRKLVQ